MGELANVISFAEAVDRRHVLVRVLRQLPAIQREVLVCRYLLDATVAETATALDIAEGTVKSAASRGLISCGNYCTTKKREVAVSIHADDEYSLRIALESELDDVLPSEGLGGLVIARHRKIRPRRVAGAVSLVVVAAGIGVPLSLSGPSGKPPQHDPGQRPHQHSGSVTPIPRSGSVTPVPRSGSVTPVPHARAGAALIIERPAPAFIAAAA